MGKTVTRTSERYHGRKHPHERGEDSLSRHCRLPAGETPPRAWGRLERLARKVLVNGNTPTSVGKTATGLRRKAFRQKHPHERGEDPGILPGAPLSMETPPRAWGRRIWGSPSNSWRRNTPTSVGKTWPQSALPDTSRKHPHERGEDHSTAFVNVPYLETPPRAWGRPQLVQIEGTPPGNTPTSVGKTPRPWPRTTVRWKHPHERGEDDSIFTSQSASLETPPRAWGRRPRPQPGTDRQGNTPTSVGKTWAIFTTSSHERKHPHERGEDLRDGGMHSLMGETPPRAWGRPRCRYAPQTGGGNTPTSVGKTNSLTPRRISARKHPHERGEDAGAVLLAFRLVETPPRAWGRRGAAAAVPAAVGNTPTSVGKTA